MELLKAIKRLARRAGFEVTSKALTLWYCFHDQDTPTRLKALILGDLIYFVSPLDAVPDIIPGVGFSDDLAVLTFALGVLAAHIKPEHREKAETLVSGLR